MRLKQFINEDRRSKEITLEECVKLLETKCIDALKGYLKGYRIYRGINRAKEDYALVDPKKGEPRKSANTYNYYTLLNDNSPYWKKYPKRSRSIICTTNEYKADMYGRLFIVFPYNGSKIGVCPENDYWISFKQSGISSMNKFNDDLYGLLLLIGYKRANIDYKTLVKGFSEIDRELKDTKKRLFGILKSKESKIRDYIENSDWGTFDDYKGGNFLEYIQKKLAPEPNDFYLAKAGDELPKNREVWTDGKSILINKKHITDVLDLMKI